LILGKYSTRQGGAQHKEELVTKILVDDRFRRYLWEMMFLHAAATPFSFRSKLQLGQGVEDLHRNYFELISELATPPALTQWKRPKLVKTKNYFQEWPKHVFNLKKFYENRVLGGINPFDPRFARQAGEEL